MYSNDPEEDVEEEEEFHEVEEEKHKTSQESVGSSNDARVVESAPQTSNNDGHNRPSDEPSQVRENQPEEKTGKEIKLVNNGHPEEFVAKSSDEASLKSNEEIVSGESVELSTTSAPLLQPPSQTSEQQPLIDDSSSSSEVEVKLEPTPFANNVAVKEIDAGEVADGMPQRDSDEQVPKDDDWANIMLKTQTSDSNRSTPDEISHNDKSNLETMSPDSELRTTDDSTMNNIIKDTQDKLKILDESLSTSIEPNVEIQQDSSTAETKINLLISEDSAKLENGNIPLASSGEDQAEKSDTASRVEDGEEKADKSEEEKPDEVEKKELDLDEDVKNPQYIPKKGVFYEHDDRSHDIDEKKPSNATKKDECTPETRDASKKAATQDRQPENRRSNRRQRTDADRWNHDLFRGEKQKPKSKSELINAYGYDIRQERGSRNQQTDNRQPRTNNNTNAERHQGSQDSQRSRQSKDNKVQRQNQPANRSRDRRLRRQNITNKNTQSKNEGVQGSEVRRDMTTSTRAPRSDVKDPKDIGDEKNVTPPATSALQNPNIRREHEASSNSRNPRNDSRGRRRSSRDRTTNLETVLPPANTVMPPITTWSNEDMMKAEAFGKRSPPRIQNQSAPTAAPSINNNLQRDRSTDFWQQSQQNKAVFQDRSSRSQDEPRQQNYNLRGRYQERGDENYRSANNAPRSHYNDRSNQNSDWHRAGNFSPYSKPTDYIVKTQTFENSRLSQANISRSSNNRDLREVLNERRMQGQPSYHNKVDHHASLRGPNQYHGHQHQYGPPHHALHQHQQSMGLNQQQVSQMAHMMQHQQSVAPHHHQQQHHQQSQQPAQRHQQLPSQAQPQASNHTNSQVSQTQQLQNHRQQQAASTPAQSQAQSRPSVTMTGAASDGNGQDSSRSGSLNSSDFMNSRPIIKTDSYTGTGLHQSQQPLSQHSQNHRSVGSGSMGPQGPATSHMVPSHLGAGASQAQYYTPHGPRDPTASAAAVATAYHGYIPGGHPVMDATRYHMASQQIADHGYMTGPGQAGDVSGGPVLHQQGMYSDASAGGTVGNSAYLTQAGSTISPSSNIPVSGTGPQPMAPVSYIQHSQYPPPPYTNPYTQTQHNQAPPQSGHAYPPYWTYI